MRWLRPLFRRKRVENELDAELRAHMAEQYDDYVRSGMNEDEARRRLRLEFGGVDQVKEECRDVRRIAPFASLWQDVRYALRALRKGPGFAAVAICTLGLGIGAATVIYSVIYNVMLAPFPYKDAARIEDLLFEDLSTGRLRGALTAEELRAYMQSRSFEETMGSTDQLMLLSTPGRTELFNVAWVTPNAFRVLGVPALIGRSLSEDDVRPGALPVTVISHKTWIKRFGGSPEALGQTLTVNERPYTIVGVMPRHFAWHNGECWLLDTLDRTEPGSRNRRLWLQGRLRPGVTREQAAAEITPMALEMARLYPDRYPKKFRIIFKTPAEFVVGQFARVLYTLMAAVGLLLLIACCNVANMLLAKASARSREISIRMALGAGSWRIARQLLTESVILGLAGATAGALVAYGGIEVIGANLPAGTFPQEAEVRLNVPVLSFSLAIGFFTAILFGMLPAWNAARGGLAGGLRAAGREAGAALKNGRVRNALVSIEAALALTLLIGAGLLMRTFLAVMDVDTGFEITRLLDVSLISQPRDPDPAGGGRSADVIRMLERIRTLPGVEKAGLILPPWNASTKRVEISDHGGVSTHDAAVGAGDEDYLAVVGTPLLRGRPFTRDDISAARRYAIINQTMASKFFADTNPIGARFGVLFNGRDGAPAKREMVEVIGVVADSKNRGLREATLPEAVLPCTLWPTPLQAILVRSANPSALIRPVQREINAIDPTVGVVATPYAEFFHRFYYARPRFSMILIGVFAATGLVLVAIGVFSVMAYAVTLRTHEIGIRLALGAGRARIVEDVLRPGLMILGIGIVCGLITSAAAVRLIQAQLWQVSPYDPLVTASGVGVVLVAGVVACLVPAWRASRVDPMRALRHE